MRIGLVDDMAWRMRQVDVTDAPCVHCGEPVASAFAAVLFEGSKQEEAVVCKLCSRCGNAHDDWVARGRPQVERDAEGQFTLGWLVAVTLRGQMKMDPSGGMRSRELWLQVLPKF